MMQQPYVSWYQVLAALVATLGGWFLLSLLSAIPFVIGQDATPWTCGMQFATWVVLIFYAGCLFFKGIDVVYPTFPGKV